MKFEIQKPYIDIINKMISLGIGDNPNEVVKQSLLAFARQFDFEEQLLVHKAVEIETNALIKDKEKLTDSSDVFAIAGL